MNERTTQMVNVRLPTDLKKRAVKIARQNGISLSDVLRITLISELVSIEAGAFRLRPCSESKANP